MWIIGTRINSPHAFETEKIKQVKAGTKVKGG